jgi:hypothetical protein
MQNGHNPGFEVRYEIDDGFPVTGTVDPEFVLDDDGRVAAENLTSAFDPNSGRRIELNQDPMVRRGRVTRPDEAGNRHGLASGIKSAK